MRVFGQSLRGIVKRSLVQAATSFGMGVVFMIPGIMIPGTVAEIKADDATAAAIEGGPIVLRSRIFDIPFQMDGGSKATMVRLYVSSDQGKTWKTASEQTIPIRQFHFEAPSDGEYWFTHSTDLKGAVDPPDQLLPERKILIDSTGPKIELNASSDLDGKLSAQVKLSDHHDVSSLRILYATDVVREWKTVANPSLDADGRFTIHPTDDWRQMSVHITATDSIGNASVDAKTFRRPRFAASAGHRYAATENGTVQRRVTDDSQGRPSPSPTGKDFPNQLRIQTAAGPSDPPSFLLGPMTGDVNPQTPNNQSLRKPGPPTAYPLQSPGAGPLRSSGPSSLRTTTPQSPGLRSAAPPSAAPPSSAPPSMNARPMAPLAAAPQRSTLGIAPNERATGSFGSSFGDMDQPNRMRTDFDTSEPKTLPASGLTAKVTPAGIEVLPAPNPDPDQLRPDPSQSTPAATPENRFAPPGELPAPAGELPAPAGNGLPMRLPSASGSPRSPDDPITEAVPTPAPDALIPNAPQQPRSLNEAMRPIAPSPQPSTSSPKPSPKPTAAGPETIPTPAPSRTPEDDRRYRADRAEQISREQQRQFDRAQLARTVPFRFSDSNRFSLEYELEAVGASGVEAVELYGSIDAGRTWKRWGADPDRTSPFDIETKGEGVFAFRIVVIGNNGLMSPRPLPGDTPDIAVIVDQTLPEIKITSARYGEGDRTGSLVIQYECSDENLITRPVAISFSDSLDGPWTTIAAGLRNDGLYVWPADPKLPPAIYLRVDATDQAGNNASYLLDQPIATGGLAPRARILGFRSR